MNKFLEKRRNLLALLAIAICIACLIFCISTYSYYVDYYNVIKDYYYADNPLTLQEVYAQYYSSNFTVDFAFARFDASVIYLLGLVVFASATILSRGSSKIKGIVMAMAAIMVAVAVGMAWSYSFSWYNLVQIMLVLMMLMVALRSAGIVNSSRTSKWTLISSYVIAGLCMVALISYIVGYSAQISVYSQQYGEVNFASKLGLFVYYLGDILFFIFAAILPVMVGLLGVAYVNKCDAVACQDTGCVQDDLADSVDSKIGIQPVNKVTIFSLLLVACGVIMSYYTYVMMYFVSYVSNESASSSVTAIFELSIVSILLAVVLAVMAVTILVSNNKKVIGIVTALATACMLVYAFFIGCATATGILALFGAVLLLCVALYAFGILRKQYILRVAKYLTYSVALGAVVYGVLYVSSSLYLNMSNNSIFNSLSMNYYSFYDITYLISDSIFYGTDTIFLCVVMVLVALGAVACIDSMSHSAEEMAEDQSHDIASLGKPKKSLSVGAVVSLIVSAITFVMLCMDSSIFESLWLYVLWFVLLLVVAVYMASTYNKSKAIGAVACVGVLIYIIASIAVAKGEVLPYYSYDFSTDIMLYIMYFVMAAVCVLLLLFALYQFGVIRGKKTGNAMSAVSTGTAVMVAVPMAIVFVFMLISGVSYSIEYGEDFFYSLITALALGVFIWIGFAVFAVAYRSYARRAFGIETVTRAKSANNTSTVADMAVTADNATGYYAVSHTLGTEPTAQVGVAMQIFLSVITLGIWYWVWLYRTTGVLNDKSTHIKDTAFVEILGCIFVPFYAVYWCYKNSKKADQYVMRYLPNTNAIATLCFVLSIFVPMLSLAIIQNTINNASMAEQNISVGSKSSSYKVASMSIAKNMFWSIFTFGIVYMVWLYRTSKTIRNKSGINKGSAFGDLLACIFLPCYASYWFYTNCQRVDGYCMQHDNKHKSTSLVCIFVGIFAPILALAIMQNSLNNVATAEGTSSMSSVDVSGTHVGLDNVALNAFLSIITFGLWYLVWIYRTTQKLNAKSTHARTSAVGEVIACIIVPMYSIFWFYKQTAKTDDYCSASDSMYKSSAMLTFVVSLFVPILALALMHNNINNALVASANNGTGDNGVQDAVQLATVEDDGVSVDTFELKVGDDSVESDCEDADNN